jgi:FHA domain-containing protein
VFRDLLDQHPVERRARPRVPFDSKLHPVDLVLGGGTDLDAQLAAGAATADELIEALYKGLGVAEPPRTGRSPAQMTLIGALLRASIAGAVRLLSVRGIAKHELGASNTQIQTRQNNPLKFSADAQDALARLLEPPQRGFIGALPAVEQTFDDLQAHEVAMLAGMRAALEAVLQRFDPAALEANLADKGMWENLLPVNRKARLWDRLVEQHARAVAAIEGDFDELFAAAFNAAYEEQLDRLHK